MNRTWISKTLLFSLLTIIGFSACKTTEQPAGEPEGPREPASRKEVEKRTVWDDMNGVTDAYYTRSYDALQPFLMANGRHQPSVDHAWRALTHVSLSKGQLQEAYSLARDVNIPQAWSALSFQDWQSAGMLDLLQSDWLRYPQLRSGLSVIMGRQGNAQNYEFLVSVMDSVAGTGAESEAALALSRLQAKHGLQTGHQDWLTKRVFVSDSEPMLNARYLYGAYRSGEPMPESLVTDLVTGWRQLGYERSSLVNQYMLKIVGGLLPSDYLLAYLNSGSMQKDVQLAIEMAGWMAEYGRPDPLYDQVMLGLLQHDNPHVQTEALLSTSNQLESGQVLSDAIRVQIQTMIVEADKTDPMVWLTAIQLYHQNTKWLPVGWYSKVGEIAQDQPYYTDHWLQVVLEDRGQETYLSTIKQIESEESVFRLLQAMNHLGEVLSSDMEWSEEQELKIREIALQALETGDRGVLYALQSILMDDRFVMFSDADRILNVMKSLQLPGDIEAYQALGRVLYQRPAFQKAAKPTIDSLATKGYEPLNSSLRSIGWDIPEPEEPMTVSPEFRPIDWERLQKLGEHPVWVLKTDRGTIKVRLNTFVSPATVSAIDALTRDRAYDGIPFHRVVRNFVIQGGDIERQDGFGGPDFVIPTEPDVEGFTRGAIGIASAGPDTEGSQYFIMHQWKPHLDGRYTRFGEVIKGMDVVDRIQMGDVVKSARWE